MGIKKRGRQARMPEMACRAGYLFHQYPVDKKFRQMRQVSWLQHSTAFPVFLPVAVCTIPLERYYTLIMLFTVAGTAPDYTGFPFNVWAGFFVRK